MTVALGPVVVDLEATVISDFERELLAHPLVGGVIFFARNFSSVPQLQDLVAEIRDLRPDLVLMVDQEGGRVQRFREGFTRLPALQSLGQLYAQDRPAALARAEQHAWLMAAELLSVGIDLSLAPVLDCDCNSSRVIGDRAFSDEPEVVVALAKAYIAGMNRAGMVATGKHFPGHGLVVNDSHVTLPECLESLDGIADNHMWVFAQLAAQLKGIMPAHIVFPQVDTRPVGFSSYWLQQILRQRLQFAGLIFSDDLSMAGARWAGDFPARAEAALAAGCDVILVCNQPQAARQVVQHLSACNIPAQSRLGELRGKYQHSRGTLAALKQTEMWQNCARQIVGDAIG